MGQERPYLTTHIAFLMHRPYPLPLEKSEKTIIFNPVVWVGVWFWAKLVSKVLIARFSQSRDSANRAIQRHILMHRAYPLPLEKKPSLTLSCGLGLGYKRMILAYYLDHFLTFQGISLDFLYLVRGRRR